MSDLCTKVAYTHSGIYFQLSFIGISAYHDTLAQDYVEWNRVKSFIAFY